MIQCLIIDDESAAIEILVHHIRKVPFLHLVKTTQNPIEGIQLINENKIDLVFLDIRMPEMNGLDFIRIIEGKSKVIFTTAHAEYALDGFELDVIDYLLKPISFPRFMKAVHKATNVISMNIIGKEEAYVGDDYIYVKTETKGKLLKIEFAAISYIESLKNYVAIHWGNEKILVLISLKELEQVLPKPRFMRIHKSYIISTERIRVIEANHAFLNGVDIPIPFGDAYKLLFLEIIKKKVINN